MSVVSKVTLWAYTGEDIHGAQA